VLLVNLTSSASSGTPSLLHSRPWEGTCRTPMHRGQDPAYCSLRR
jgi:hypothetical protein